MQNLLTIFIISLSLGQLGTIFTANNIVIYIYDVLLAILAVYLLLSGNIRKFHKYKLCKPLSYYLTWSLFTLIMAVGFLPFYKVGISFLYLFRFALYISLYFIAVNVKGKKSVLYSLFISGSIVALMGIFQLIFYPNISELYYLGWDPHYFRLVSTMLDPNFSGIVIVLTIFLGLFLYRKHNRKIMLFLLIFLFVSLLLTYSRSSILGLIAGAAIYAISKKKIKELLAVFFLILVFFIIPKPNIIGFNLLRTETLVFRVGNWQENLKLFYAKPVTGYGFNTLFFIHDQNDENSRRGIPSKAAAGVDNSMLFVLLTTGSVGLALYLWLMYRVYQVSVKLLSRKKTNINGLLILASWIAVITHSSFINSLFYPFIMAWLWIITGLGESKIIQNKEKSKNIVS